MSTLSRRDFLAVGAGAGLGALALPGSLAAMHGPSTELDLVKGFLPLTNKWVPVEIGPGGSMFLDLLSSTAHSTLQYLGVEENKVGPTMAKIRALSGGAQLMESLSKAAPEERMALAALPKLATWAAPDLPAATALWQPEYLYILKVPTFAHMRAGISLDPEDEKPQQRSGVSKDHLREFVSDPAFAEFEKVYHRFRSDKEWIGGLQERVFDYLAYRIVLAARSLKVLQEAALRPDSIEFLQRQQAWLSPEGLCRDHKLRQNDITLERRYYDVFDAALLKGYVLRWYDSSEDTPLSKELRKNMTDLKTQAADGRLELERRGIPYEHWAEPAVKQELQEWGLEIWA